MGVSTNADAPKFLVCNGASENSMDDLGVPSILGHTHIIYIYLYISIFNIFLDLDGP